MKLLLLIKMKVFIIFYKNEFGYKFEFHQLYVNYLSPIN